MPHRYIIRKVRDFVVFKILHVQDSPHRIALGVALGVFIGWTPTIPFQMAAALLVCWIFRANKAAGVPMVWVTNYVTMVPIYGFNYVVGCWMLGRDYTSTAFLEKFRRPGSIWDKMQAWVDVIWDFGLPLWLGSVAIGLVLALASYFLTKWWVRAYRARRRRKLIAKGVITEDVGEDDLPTGEDDDQPLLAKPGDPAATDLSDASDSDSEGSSEGAASADRQGVQG